MTTNKTAANRAKHVSLPGSVEATTLVHRYGQIGISAVAAAARYQGVSKNPAYAPTAGERLFDWARDAS